MFQPQDNTPFEGFGSAGQGRRPLALVQEGVVLHTVKYQGDSGVPVLLAHGAAHTHHSFDNIADDLCAKYSLFAYDLRGHGESGRNSDRSYSHEQLSRDMAEVIRLHARAPAVIIGSSLSGLTALRTAAQFPELVRGLVLVDILPTLRERVLDNLRKFFRMSDFDSFEQMVDKYGFLSPSRSNEDIAGELRFAAEQRSNGKWGFNFDDAVIDIVSADRLAEFEQFIPLVRCPVLLLRGGKSTVVPDEALDRFRELCDDSSRFHSGVLGGGSHCPWRENPSEFLQQVQGFVEKLPHPDDDFRLPPVVG